MGPSASHAKYHVSKTISVWPAVCEHVTHSKVRKSHFVHADQHTLRSPDGARQVMRGAVDVEVLTNGCASLPCPAVARLIAARTAGFEPMQIYLRGTDDAHGRPAWPRLNAG